MAITILKLFAFIISNIGTWEFLRRRTKIDINFLPIVTIAAQVAILYIAGYAHFLKIGAVLIWAAGIVYFVAVIVKDKNIKFLKNFSRVGYMFLGITMLIMVIFCVGKMYTTWDNFSHWGIVVKQMFTKNRFPNAFDSVIFYKEYPLGSSIYIYYFGFISKSEPLQLLAQIYMIVASIMPVFAFAKKNKIAALITTLSFTNLILVYNIYVTDLSVDTLLAAVGMSAFLFIYMYMGDLKKQSRSDKRIFAIAAALLLVLTIQIKNSGIFFVVIAIIWLIYQAVKNKDFWPRFVCMLVPIASLVAWRIHCSIAFKDADTSVHAMTLKNFINVLNTKSSSNLEKIASSFVKFAFTYKDFWITFALLVIVGVMIFFLHKEYRKSWLTLFIISVILYILYQIGMLGMYFFTMPLSEALELACITRYTKTILIVILIIALIMIINLIANLEMKKVISIACVVIAVALPVFFVKVCTGKFKFAVQYLDYPMTIKKHVESLKDEYGIEEQSSYKFLIGDEDKGYVYMLGRCSFLSTEVSTLKVDDGAVLDEIDAKYIIILDKDNKEIENWVQKNYPAQAGREVIVQRN